MMKTKGQSGLIRAAVEAHGGIELWSSLKAIDAEISASGFLFTAKHRPVLRRVRIRALTREPQLTFFDFPFHGQYAELSGSSEVTVRSSDGKILARRGNPRSDFTDIRHMLWWDDLDFVYFGGYATWNYLVTPFIFMWDGFDFEELGPLPGRPSWSRIRVTYPDDIPVHCRTQVYYFDETGLIRRLDYTAEVVGKWAHAAHFCDDYHDFNGLKVPTKRKVLPLPFGTRPLPGPTLVRIEVHDIRPVPL